MRHLVLLAALVIPCAASFAQTGEHLPAFPGKILCTGTTPVNGTNAVETLTLSSTGAGVYKVSFSGATGVITLTGTEAPSVVATKFQTLLVGIPTIGAAGVAITTGTATAPVVLTGTFGGNLAKRAVAQWVPSVVSGTCTLTGTTTVPGVEADGRIAPRGALLIDIGDASTYQNTGNPPNPTWTKISP